MKLERRRRYGENLTKITEGEFVSPSFDGYYFAFTIDCGDSNLHLVTLERHEAEKLARFVLDELAAQRKALDELRTVTERIGVGSPSRG